MSETKSYFSLYNLVNLIFCFLPISLILGSLVLNLNILLLLFVCLRLVFINNLNTAYKTIQSELYSQENYIWSEDIQFNEALSKSNTNNVDVMRNLANNYFRSVVYILQDTIPKKIMYELVNKSQKDIGSKLYEVVKGLSLEDLLKEVEDIHEKRTNLESVVKDLTNAKKLIEDIM